MEIMVKRVFTIGLDGATWDILDPYMQKGSLPNLKRIVDSGVRGYLKSTIPPNSPIAWSSFMTGANPGKHGIFGFTEHLDGDSYLKRPLSQRAMRLPTMWDILSRKGVKNITINVPVTYPPKEINGCLISGMFTPSTHVDYTYPSTLKEELGKAGIQYKINIKEPIAADKGSAEFFKDLYNVTENRYLAAKYLISNKKWDFFTVVFTGIDRLQHRFMDSIVPGRGKNDSIGREVDKYFRYLDERIGNLMQLAGKDANIVFLSDHGFAKLKGALYINKWLLDKGLLHPAKRNGNFIWNMASTLKKFVKKIGLAKIIKGAMGESKTDYIVLKTHKIDWQRTKAFLFLSDGIRINLRKREIYGSVDMADFEETRNEIIRGLMAIKNTMKEPIIEKVFKKEEVYSGNQIDNAPDLIIKFRDDNLYEAISEEMHVDSIFDPHVLKEGNHTPYGICAFFGNGIKKSYEIKNAEIIDIMPTIMHIMGFPIPEYVDGRPLLDIFDETFLKSNKVAYDSSINPADFLSPRDFKYDRSTEKEIVRQLKSLGYLG